MIYHDSPLEYFGYGVASFTDFDGDGVEDFAVAIPCDNQRGPLSGSVKIYSGRPAYERLNLQGSAPGDLFGSSIARVPDLDCDGIDELLVGAPGASPNGRASGEAIVFSGADARILLRIPGQHAGDECGAAVCAVGDLNGDHVAEIAVGSPGARPCGWNSGLVRVYDGADLHELFTFKGEGFGERFGASLAGPGDMSGDGIPEIAVGAPCPRLARPGYVHCFNGADASILYSLGGRHTWELFGAALAATGDCDGDGHADLLVGAPTSRSGAAEINDAVDHACGAATLFSGANGQPLFSFASDESEDRFGAWVALGPDLDGDGHADLLIGASQALRPRAGYVRAYGARTGQALRSWTGSGSGDQFGACFASLKSASGSPLLVVGSPSAKNILPDDATRGGPVGSVTLIETEPR